MVSGSSTPAGGLASKVQALILYRALFVTLLLGSSVALDIRFGVYFYSRSLSSFIVVLYGLTALYGLLFPRFKDRPAFAQIQFVLDVIAETALIFITGGIESWFAFTYLLSILSAGIVFSSQAGFSIATLSTVLYSSLLALQANGVILTRVPTFAPITTFFYNIFIHIVSFYSMAFLTSQLTDRLRRMTETLQQTDLDLSDLKAFSRDLIESIPMGLITTSQEGTIRMANPSAHALLSWLRGGLVGRNVFELFPFVENRADGGGNFEGVMPVEGGDGRTLGVILTPLKDRTGLPVGRIVIFNDLTEVRALEKEMLKRKQLAAVGELSASIAHEIRNPLASLKSSMEMLREEREPSRYSLQLMEIAIKEMDRLNAIITDFLTYARPRPPSKRSFDLAALIRETTLPFSSQKRIEIRHDLPDTAFVDGDPSQLKQVFLNLVLNAIEAMPDGGTLSLSLRLDPNEARVEVQDTGPGISPENLERVFYPYFTTKERGTGFGLAIAYRIVEEHGGSMSAASPAGGGARFTVRLPVAVAPQGDAG